MTPITTLSRKRLQITNTHDTIVVAWKAYAKGGHFDSYGLSYSRGGVNRTEILCRYGQEDAEKSRDAGLQVWQGMAHRQDRVRGVEKAEAQSVRFVSGKLNNSSSVAHLRHVVSQAPSRRRCLRYLVVYFLTLRRACLVSPVRIDEIWQEVAAREVL
jgi:hypothetical protein